MLGQTAHGAPRPPGHPRREIVLARMKQNEIARRGRTSSRSSQSLNRTAEEVTLPAQGNPAELPSGRER